jgi:hypothetical protein
MYHYREWKDVTEFTDGCDLAQRPGVHLPRWTDVVQDFYSGTKPDCSPALPPRTSASASPERLRAKVSCPLVGSLDLDWTTPGCRILLIRFWRAVVNAEYSGSLSALRLAVQKRAWSP